MDEDLEEGKKKKSGIRISKSLLFNVFGIRGGIIYNQVISQNLNKE